ncbi:DUF6461 domain-containing protein [Actinomadura sp. 7K507]|uniref:DUF6461 domain-containing protein n=1 Tax=Actinomadura sp. 7K507 TaxID=2530365 RepID=UPI0010505D7B|nr:DUF6461 domain-containing protein [Actinomadura sp. 7K507]TDC74788.1 hypothetical protein E1285_42560 [Actinomadura sp. 7K507]
MSTSYDWLGEFGDLEGYMFVGFVHGADPSGLLVSMDAGTVTGEMTFDQLKQQPTPSVREVPPNATRLGATRLGAWTVLWSDNAVANQLIDALVKAAPARAMVIVAGSYSISSQFLYRRDGFVQLAFEPYDRTAITGQDAESFVPLMASAGVPLIPVDRATGLPLDSDADDPGDPIRGSLTLADQITGTHLTAEVLRGAFTWGLFTRDDFSPAKPVSTHPLRDTENIESALEAATPTARSRAVMFALQHIAEDAQVTGDPVVTRALEAVRQGHTEPPADLAPVLQAWRQEARSAPKRWEVGPNDTEKIAQMRRGVYRNRLAEALEAAYGIDPAQAAAAVISHVRHDVTARPRLLDILKQ